MNFKINETDQKLRGGYYTPEALTNFINNWILDLRPESVLEPSCGDGIFIKNLLDKEKKINITAFEIFDKEARKAEKLLKSNDNKHNLFVIDFLKWTVDQFNSNIKFDAVIGNPPFIRYQYLSTETQDLTETIFKLLKLNFTKHTNIWVPFILSSIHFLRPGGRLGMVVPAEILHVMHAQSLRTYLGENCQRILIFDPEDLWFENTLQGAVILFAEKKKELKSESKGLGIIKTKGYNFTKKNPAKLFENANYINGKTIEGKWTYALLNNKEFDLLKNISIHKEVFRFKEIASVDVGIVTGANKFFLVNDDVIDDYNLEQFAHPMFGRSEHCPGVIYDKKQHELNASNGTPSNFLWFDKNGKLNDRQRKYIENGEKQELHTRYKCRIRNPWYTVPSVYTTKVGMLKRSHEFPRLIYNELEAFTTDTAYRIKSFGIDESYLVFCFCNTLTALTAELEGRHYGGGVLELVPSEIEKLLIPLPKGLRIKRAIKQLNKAFLEKTSQIEILSNQDTIILSSLGLLDSEISMLQSAKLRLKHRRHRTTE